METPNGKSFSKVLAIRENGMAIMETNHPHCYYIVALAKNDALKKSSYLTMDFSQPYIEQEQEILLSGGSSLSLKLQILAWHSDKNEAAKLLDNYCGVGELPEVR